MKLLISIQILLCLASMINNKKRVKRNKVQNTKTDLSDKLRPGYFDLENAPYPTIGIEWTCSNILPKIKEGAKFIKFVDKDGKVVQSKEKFRSANSFFFVDEDLFYSTDESLYLDTPEKTDSLEVITRPIKCTKDSDDLDQVLRKLKGIGSFPENVTQGQNIIDILFPPKKGKNGHKTENLELLANGSNNLCKDVGIQVTFSVPLTKYLDYFSYTLDDFMIKFSGNNVGNDKLKTNSYNPNRKIAQFLNLRTLVGKLSEILVTHDIYKLYPLNRSYKFTELLPKKAMTSNQYLRKNPDPDAKNKFITYYKPELVLYFEQRQHPKNENYYGKQDFLKLIKTFFDAEMGSDFENQSLTNIKKYCHDNLNFRPFDDSVSLYPNIDYDRVQITEEFIDRLSKTSLEFLDIDKTFRLLKIDSDTFDKISNEITIDKIVFYIRSEMLIRNTKDLKNDQGIKINSLKDYLNHYSNKLAMVINKLKRGEVYDENKGDFRVSIKKEVVNPMKGKLQSEPYKDAFSRSDKLSNKGPVKLTESFLPDIHRGRQVNNLTQTVEVVGRTNRGQSNIRISYNKPVLETNPYSSTTTRGTSLARMKLPRIIF